MMNRFTLFSGSRPVLGRGPGKWSLASQCPWLLGLLLASAVTAGETEIVDVPLSNGDFSAGLGQWVVEVSPDASLPAGSVTVSDGAALITKGGAFRAGLSRAFQAPEGLLAVRLRIAQMPVLSGTGDFIPEAFDIHLTGPGGFSRAATFRPAASAVVNATAVPAGFTLGQDSTLEGDELRIPVSGAVAGETLLLAAALVGASSDATATVAIDDVILEVEQDVAPPPVVRVDGCELFRDSFEASSGFGSIARCPLGQVGDTGIDACAGGPDGSCPVPELPGQDADHGRDALARAGALDKLGHGPAGFDYTKLDANGDPLSASADSWSCVLDNVTGLVWEVKIDDPLDPSHHAHSYSWYQPDATMDGGDPGLIDAGSCSGSACDTMGLAITLNDALHCGARGWRLPTREELLNLVDAGRSNPAIVTELFPLGPGVYWSSTPMSADAAAAWQLDFIDGRTGTSPKTTPLKLRMVREID